MVSQVHFTVLFRRVSDTLDTWQDEVDKTMESVGKELEDSFEAVLQNRRFRMLGKSTTGCL